MKKGFIKTLAIVMLLTLSIGMSVYAMVPGYNSFTDLFASEDAADYTIKTTDIGSDTTILALHGGGIERGTSELVEALNGYDRYNTYLFEGLKTTDNGSLFVKAINFDEPEAVNLVQKSDYTLSVIGAAGEDETTYIGGQNKLLAELIRLHLISKGFNVKTLSIPDRIAGIMDSNIVNKNKLLKDTYQIGGVQVAVSKGLRDKFTADSGILTDYSDSIHKALSEGWPIIVSYLKKMPNASGVNKGFLNKLDPSKKNFDKKFEKVLEKGAKTPDELYENVEEIVISEE